MTTNHNFGEAFMLMWYACDKCGHCERIWNSRDGITPFGSACPSCGSVMNHVEWERDEYAPNHVLHQRQRFWRDGTPDEAEAIMRRRIATYSCPPQTAAQLIAAVKSGTFDEFRAGWPMLDEKNPVYSAP